MVFKSSNCFFVPKVFTLPEVQKSNIFSPQQIFQLKFFQKKHKANIQPIFEPTTAMPAISELFQAANLGTEVVGRADGGLGEGHGALQDLGDPEVADAQAILVAVIFRVK